jgi:hypothetical protein
MKSQHLNPIAFIFSVITILATTTLNAAPADKKSCINNSVCGKDEFCDTTPKCPDEKTTGVCIQKPTFCTMEYVPVKGCDGKEYSNRCHAQAEGQPDTGLVESTK